MTPAADTSREFQEMKKEKTAVRVMLDDAFDTLKMLAMFFLSTSGVMLLATISGSPAAALLRVLSDGDLGLDALYFVATFSGFLLLLLGVAVCEWYGDARSRAEDG
jgi:hypothetical protein